MTETSTETPQNTEPAAKKYVVFDWNIIQYYMSKDMRDSMSDIFRELDDAGLIFSVSHISTYEAQRQLPVSKSDDSHSVLDSLPQFPLDAEVLMLAGTIACCYKDLQQTRSHADEISLQDTLNAATAIKHGAFLITADYADYPRPFFDEVYRWEITDKRSRPLKIYLFNFDLKQFTAISDKWIKAENAKQLQRPKKDV